MKRLRGFFIAVGALVAVFGSMAVGGWAIAVGIVVMGLAFKPRREPLRQPPPQRSELTFEAAGGEFTRVVDAPTVSYEAEELEAALTEGEFWSYIDRAAEVPLADRLEVIIDILYVKETAAELAAFGWYFRRALAKANTWDLWAAAYIICGGCSDDGFIDFRSALVSLGRRTFEVAVDDPQTLADVSDQAIGELRAGGEMFSNAAFLAHFNVTRSNMEIPPVPYADDPTGVPFDELRVMERHPKLAVAFRDAWCDA